MCLALSLPSRNTKSAFPGPVAQQFPTSAQAIYEVLANDVEFVTLLGTYEFRAGQTSPALSIVTAGSDIPALRKVQGVECVIQDAGDFTQGEYITNDAPRLQVRWSVFLVCWEPATGADMQAAAERACRRFLGSQAIQTVAVADGLGAQVQTKIIIRSEMLILAP